MVWLTFIHCILRNIPTSKSWATIDIAINFTAVVPRTSSYKDIVSLIDLNNDSTSNTAVHSIDWMQIHHMDNFFVNRKLSNVTSISPLPNCPGKHIETRPWCSVYTNMGMIAIPNVCYYIKDIDVVNSQVSRDISWQIRIKCNWFLWCYLLTTKTSFIICKFKKVWNRQQSYSKI